MLDRKYKFGDINGVELPLNIYTYFYQVNA